MPRSRPKAYEMFRALRACDASEAPPRRKSGRWNGGSRYPAPEMATSPLPPLAPYQRCGCGRCRECQEDARWDRIFKKFETKQMEAETRGLFQSPLSDL